LKIWLRARSSEGDERKNKFSGKESFKEQLILIEVIAAGEILKCRNGKNKIKGQYF